MLHGPKRATCRGRGGRAARPLVVACRVPNPSPPARLVLAAASLAIAAGVLVSPLPRFLLEPSDVLHDYLPQHKRRIIRRCKVQRRETRQPDSPPAFGCCAGKPTPKTCTVCGTRAPRLLPCKLFATSLVLASGALGVPNFRAPSVPMPTTHFWDNTGYNGSGLQGGPINSEKKGPYIRVGIHLDAAGVLVAERHLQRCLVLVHLDHRGSVVEQQSGRVGEVQRARLVQWAAAVLHTRGDQRPRRRCARGSGRVVVYVPLTGGQVSSFGAFRLTLLPRLMANGASQAPRTHGCSLPETLEVRL